ncbi:MAG: tRNA (adenosine(37)-N6)-threonylcarbamoyltransferase complex dimerization subunit type 1 TsaB [Candidatus Omnitrophica bacterium]|nr:tRNA (adenosine(37)-N6)-threonylcarbamoyltransferase complex dimerization subunit type 1 TsaB [Candidatus Omnitrophota bacterium]
MKILGIDTTTQFMNIGICDNLRIYTYSLHSGKLLEGVLMPTIKRILAVLGWQPKDIDYFVCSVGPGSFTGIRIGLATIKGFAWSLDKPVVGISSLDTIARNAISFYGAVIAPILDAKRNLVYCSIYKNLKGRLRRVTPYMLLTEHDFYKRAKGVDIVLGDAVDLYKDNIIRNIRGVIILDRDYWYPRPDNLIILALERIQDKKISSAFKIEPLYLYPKECQIKIIN